MAPRVHSLSRAGAATRTRSVRMQRRQAPTGADRPQRPCACWQRSVGSVLNEAAACPCTGIKRSV
eukprot:6195408-Pleurochrysis_carterae.AAC.1